MNKIPMSIPNFEGLPLDTWLSADPKSDRSGEHGAVMIYRGILATTRRDDIRDFALRHLRSELEHRIDADARLDDSGGVAARAWSWLISAGSAVGVKVARMVQVTER